MGWAEVNASVVDHDVIQLLYLRSAAGVFPQMPPPSGAPAALACWGSETTATGVCYGGGHWSGWRRETDRSTVRYQ